MLPCRRFADVLADACARLGADVDRYSFIAVDFHHILLAGLPAHSLALRPAHSRQSYAGIWVTARIKGRTFGGSRLRFRRGIVYLGRPSATGFVLVGAASFSPLQ